MKADSHANRPGEVIKFTKMQGAGNDYIYIDCMRSMPDRPEELAREMSDRHYGVGSDGLVLICPSEVADLKMRMFNADGSEAGMCGNASRCIGLYAAKFMFADNPSLTPLTLETRSGIKELLLHRDEAGEVESVTVDMGAPRLDCADIPVSHPAPSMIDAEVATSLGPVKITAVSMGNPHGVIFVDNLDEVPFDILGPELENHPIWPERANIEFVEVTSPTSMKMRVWERGSGETLACGTGACAATVAAILTGRTGRLVDVTLRGGVLGVSLDAASGHVMLTGGAEVVFEGNYFRQH